MCGIVGIVRFDPHETVDERRLARMGDALRHRGPDDGGQVVAGNVGLGHRRLAIIDLSHGHQPMASADRRVWITYNGELYNYTELREQLMMQGCRFATASDTEVVLKAYEVFGEDCVEHFRGMFAFAIWDQRNRKLFAARDRLGIKPLYFACTAGELVFASEIKAILAGHAVNAEFNRGVLPEFLAAGYVCGAETFFRDVWKLLPGRSLSWSPGREVRQRRFWRLPESVDTSGMSMERRAEEVRVRLEDAVRCHLASDVPVGVFLSGGIDSTGLASLAAAMSERPLQSFAVGVEEQRYSELDHARRAAAWIGTEHREAVVSPQEFASMLPRLVWHEDEPIAFPSSILLHRVSRLAAQHVKVVLTGEGADELFLGYNRYRVTAWNERVGRLYWAAVPQRLRRRIVAAIGGLPSPLRRYAERSFLGHEAGIRGLLYDNFSVFSGDLRRALCGDTAGHGQDPHEHALRYYREAPAGTLERMSHADLQTYLVELLMKQDQMSMAASIESRVPFLDHKLVEYVSTLPGRYKLRGMQTKAVLRKAMHDLVPREIMARRKMGFPVPVGPWFRGPLQGLVDEFILSPRALSRDLFHRDALHRLIQEHQAGRRDHGSRLWLLINLEIWQRIFVDGEEPETVLDGCGPAPALRVAA